MNDLGEKLYKWSRAGSEQAIDRVPGEDNVTRKGLMVMYKKMVLDSKPDGPRHAIELLYTIGKPVLRSIIQNTIGYDTAHNIDSINDFLLPSDNCAGAYIVTIRVRDGK